MSPPTRRTFVALEGAPATVDAWERLGADARKITEAEGSRRAKWVPRANLHVTLAFLGATDDAQLPAIAEALAAIEIPPGPLAVRDVGLRAFPHTMRGNVFVLELDVTPALAQLQRTVAAAVEGLGFQLETRPYLPHATLARFSPSRDLSGLAAAVTLAPAATSVLTTLTHYDSASGDDGVVYTPLFRRPLA